MPFHTYLKCYSVFTEKAPGCFWSPFSKTVTLKKQFHQLGILTANGHGHPPWCLQCSGVASSSKYALQTANLHSSSFGFPNLLYHIKRIHLKQPCTWYITILTGLSIIKKPLFLLYSFCALCFVKLPSSVWNTSLVYSRDFGPWKLFFSFFHLRDLVGDL